MNNLDLKIKEMTHLINCLDNSDIKNAMLSVMGDINLLQDSEIQTENAWESAMLALIGTDGIGGVKRIIIKMLETLESIELMPPETAANSAPAKAKNVLDLINDEKLLSRSDHKVFNKF